ncbi:MAG: sigma 54-interacting transcriptional regulator [Pseudomonadota bacterium]
MKINEKEFFHQVTIRICGSLEIDHSLRNCFEYLKDYIPLEEIWMGLLDKEFKNIRAIAHTDTAGTRTMDTIIPLPRVLNDKQQKQGLTPKKVMILNHMAAHRLSDDVAFPKSSVMIFPLLPEGDRMGVLVLRAGGQNRYLNTHARLLSMLHDPFVVAMSNNLRHEEVIKLKDMLADDNRYLSRELRQLAGDEIVGAQTGLKNVMDMVQQVAPRDNPVLLLGETGVGKEVIANAIHYASPRKNGPFIKVNSGAIPEGLIDSELFGHEKGAFTGAVSQKRGRFERAHGGTIFLDEIGDLPMQAQVRLLRVLQQKEMERVGGTETIAVDVRIITATHRNLEQLMVNNKFREDLWYRLNVFPIIIPPLRQRKSDIPLLIEHFLKRKSRELNFRSIPQIVPGAVERLMDYPWKGNVRELENVVERALIQYNGSLLNFDHFVFPQVENASLNASADDNILKFDEVCVRHIKTALEATHGRISGPYGAAKLLGLLPSTLRGKMNKLGIMYGRKQ